MYALRKRFQCHAFIFIIIKRGHMDKDSEILKNLIGDILKFAKKYSDALDKGSAPLWYYAKENYNVTLDAILFNDILNWLTYLGLSDGNLCKEELKFINYILDTSFSKEDILDYLNNNPMDDYENTIPTSFIVFYEFDKYTRDNGNKSSGEIVESLYNIFGSVGQQFIKLDKDLTESEKEAFDTFMGNLRINLDDLKKFNYQNMVMDLNTEILENILDFKALKEVFDEHDPIVLDKDWAESGSAFNTDYLDVLDKIFDKKDDSDSSKHDSKGYSDSSKLDEKVDSKNELLDKFKDSLDNIYLENLSHENGTGESSENDADTNSDKSLASDEKDKADESDLDNEVDLEDEQTLEDILAKLNKLVGLENVKKDVNSLINLIQIRKIREERGIKQPDMSLHLVFSGNPGTGKTTVARLLGEIYSKLGILSKGHLVETDRSGLVAGYVGQTAIKTQDRIKEAMGGILFIDEAYSLSASKGENDFGQEAIDTILKAMEDNREDFIVIVAGYPKLMDDFLHSNPGLESRFNKHLFFDDYNPQELFDIFVSMEEGSSLKLDKKAEEFLKGHFEDVYKCRGENFANGRYVRNIFEKVLSNQADRLVNIEDISDEDLNTLIIEDFHDCW